MPIEPVVLENAFVRLEPMTIAHEPELREAGRDPRIWTYMQLDGSTDKGMARLVREALIDPRQDGALPYVVRMADTSRLVGSTRFLAIMPVDRYLEIGWTWYHPNVWASAVNPASKLAMMSCAFDVLGMVRVGLSCDARNQRSHDAIIRLGATKEGVLRRQKLVRNRFIRDTVKFSILADEWPDVRAGLHRRLGID